MRLLERPGALHAEAVAEGSVDRQRHALLEPVVDHRGNEWRSLGATVSFSISDAMIRTSYGVCLRAFAARRSTDAHRCWNVSICLATRLVALDEGSKKYVEGKRKPSMLRRFRNGLNGAGAFAARVAAA